MAKIPNLPSSASPRSYWYRFFVGECPVCGRDKSYKERVYGTPKPTNPSDRYVQLSHQETFDHCL